MPQIYAIDDSRVTPPVTINQTLPLYPTRPVPSGQGILEVVIDELMNHFRIENVINARLRVVEPPADVFDARTLRHAWRPTDHPAPLGYSSRFALGAPDANSPPAPAKAIPSRCAIGEFALQVLAPAKAGHDGHALFPLRGWSAFRGFRS